MFIKTFKIENFGPIREVELKFNQGFNVLAGVNGAGKTSILTALTLILSRYVSAIRTGRPAGTFNRDQIHKVVALRTRQLKLSTKTKKLGGQLVLLVQV